MSTPTAPRARQDLEQVSLGDTAFAFDRVARRLHRLNPSAAVVLSQLDGRRSVAALAARLAEVFAVDPEQLTGEVTAVVDEFAAAGLLEGTTPEPLAPTGAAGTAPTAAPTDVNRLAERFRHHRWPVRLGPFRALGFTFGVCTDDRALGAHLGEVLEPLRMSTPPADRPSTPTFVIRAPAGSESRWRLYLEGVRLAVLPSAARASENLLWRLNRYAVHSLPGMSVLHAGAVARDGVAVVLPAESDAGKSTLVTGLVAAGFDYLSDEAVGLDAGDLLQPYPKAVSLDRGSWPLFPELAPAPRHAELHSARWQIPPERIRPASVSGPVTVAAIVVPRYRAGESTRWEPLEPTDAFALLLEQAFGVAERPDALDQMARLVERVGAQRLVSGSLEGSVAAVCDLVEGLVGR
jgi:hypothetical protein